MTVRISIRLGAEVRQELEREARSRGLPLATFLREVATETARHLRRKRIGEQSEAVGRYVASHPHAKEFYEFWGRPDWEGLGEPPQLRSRLDDE